MKEFEKKLDKALDNPPVDPDTGAILEAEVVSGSYEDALKKQLIPEKLYEMYVKFVGKLNALPHTELKVKELVDPRTGNLFPFRSWPTKQSREVSSANWSAYNMQLQKPEAAPELKVSPCQNPEAFIQQAMRDCIHTSQRVAKWDTATAARKCGKQVDMLRKAVYDYCNGEGGEEFLQGLLQQMGEPEPTETPTDTYKAFDKAIEQAPEPE
jgi:hypothetical protein